jgi:RND family efflux transporter MFP subunit
MSSPPIKAPNLRRLLLVAMVAIAAASSIAISGVMSRGRSNQDLVQWTNTQAIPTVALATVARGEAEQKLILPGTIQPHSKALIYARVSGYLKSYEQDIGAHVKVGQLLATIDTPDLDQQLAQGKADLATAQANEQLAITTANRWRAMIARQLVAQQEADMKIADEAANKAMVAAADANVQRLQAMEAFKNVVSPYDGVVTMRNTSVGALINAGSSVGQQLFEVSDLHSVRIYVQVPQAFSAVLRPGAKASFTMPQYPGRSFEATLVTTSNAVDATSRSLLVELQAENSGGELMGGAYCQVSFQIPSDPNTVRVPATALMPVNNGMQVAVLGGDNKVVLKPIQLGRDFGDSVEVIAGLAPQDRVIDQPPDTLQTGDSVQLAAGIERIAAVSPAASPAQ